MQGFKFSTMVTFSREVIQPFVEEFSIGQSLLNETVDKHNYFLWQIQLPYTFPKGNHIAG